MVVVLAVSWLAQLLGLPGNWLIVAAAVLDAWLMGPDATGAISWQTVFVLAALAVAGEIAELAASAAGVKQVGGSRRGAVLAIAGSIVGSIVGLFVGVPIPIVGSLVAAVLFGAVGALAGAVLGESWKGRDFDASLTVGKAAFVGRVLGTVAKMIVSSLMVAVTLGAIVLP